MATFPGDISTVFAGTRRVKPSGTASVNDSNIANAISAVSAGGGGRVYLDPGYYLTTTNLPILPDGVSLIGPHGHNPRSTKQENVNDPTAFGCVLGIVSGAGTPNGTAFIQPGNNSTISGLLLYWPNQGIPGVSTILQYPPGIGSEYDTSGGNGSASMHLGKSEYTIRNVGMINAYQGIRCNGSYQFLIEDCWINTCVLGVAVDQSWDFSHISRVYIEPAYWLAANPASSAAIDSYMQANCYGFRIGHVDSLHMSHCGVYDGFIGISLEQSTFATSPRLPWTRIHGCDIDICDIGIDAQYTQPQGVSFVGGGISTPPSSTNNLAVRVGSSCTNLRVTGSSLISQSGKEVQINGGTSLFSGCDFGSYGAAPTGTSASIQAPAGSGTITISGCTFADTRPQINWSSSGLCFWDKLGWRTLGVTDPGTKVHYPQT